MINFIKKKKLHLEPIAKSTSADLHFLREWPIHPMVAFFISLPVEPDVEIDNLIIQHNESPLELFTQRYFDENKGSSVFVPVPQMMSARRIYLYLFSMFYFSYDAEFNGKINKKDWTVRLSSKDVANLGYEYKTPRKRQELDVAFKRVLLARYRFMKSDDNAIFGPPPISKDYGHTLFTLKLSKNNNEIFGLDKTSAFMFKAGFPINFSHVLGTNKRCSFWNVYLLLVDILPRVPRNRELHISWMILRRIFRNRYSDLAAFSFNFKKNLNEVLEIYPQAKDKVRFDKYGFYYRYAPPPI